MLEPRRGVLTARSSTLLFFAAIWFLGCFYFLGDLGHYSDDWSIAPINPVTHAPLWDSHPLERNYFWRPLLQLFLHFAFMLTWEQIWVLHLFNVICHAAAGMGLMALCRRLGFPYVSSAVAGFIFLLFPYQYEVIFWSTAVTTGIPAGLMILLCYVVSRYAQRPSILTLLTMPALSFIIPCWYEQPCSLAAGFIFLCWAMRGETPAPKMLGRILTVLVACGIPMIAYIVLLATTAPAGARGGTDSFVTLPELPARLTEMRGAMSWYLTSRLQGSLAGSIQTGLTTLATPTAAIIGGLVAVIGGVWACTHRTPDAGNIASVANDNNIIDSTLRTRRVYGWIFGIVAMLAAWLPVIPFRGQILEARMAYCACIGLGITCAGVVCGLEAIFARLRWGNVLHATMRIAIAAVIWVGAVGMLGWQTLIRTRTQADAKQTQTLANHFASVPPGTIFITLRDDYRAGNTGNIAFDWPALGWTSASWSATPALRYAMKRDDIAASAYNIWVPTPFNDVSQNTVTYTGSLWPIPNVTYNTTPTGILLDWSKVVPFVLTPKGEAEPVGQIEFVFTSGDPPVIVRPPLTTSFPGKAVITVPRPAP